MSKLEPFGRDLPAGVVEAGEWHLVLDDELTEDRWAELLTRAARMQRTLAWWIGDLLVAAENRLDGERFDPDRYARAAGLTGKSYSTLRQYAYMARHVPPSNRLDGPIRWFVKVARFAPERQAELLAVASQHGMSADEFETYVDTYVVCNNHGEAVAVVSREDDRSMEDAALDAVRSFVADADDIGDTLPPSVVEAVVRRALGLAHRNRTLPRAFPVIDVLLDTAYRCPDCGYGWNQWKGRDDRLERLAALDA